MAVAKFGLQPLQDLPPTNRLNLAIGLPLRNQAALDRFLQQLQDPASTNYHRYLTPQEFTAQYGPSTGDYESVINFTRTNGLTVTHTYSNRVLVDVSGDVKTIEKVFHVKMHLYRHPMENRNFFAPDSEPSVDLNVPLLHIGGLNNFTLPRPALVKKYNSAGTQPASGSGPYGLLMGADFRNAYIPGVALNGAGQTVGLFELDGYYSNDIVAYENQASLPHAAITNVYVDDYDGEAGSGNLEVALDIEMVASMATNLTGIIVYEESNGGDIADLLNRIVSDNLAKQISSSWLIGDDPSYDTAYQQMAAQGQSFFQASGDDGAFYPGIEQSTDDTNITLVGGTTLTMNGTGNTYQSETVWNGYTTEETPPLVSGGGVSLNDLPIPIWQTGINMTANGGSTTDRNVPDVAMNADNIFCVAENGQQEQVVGTSGASPLWAAFVALVNQQAQLLGRPTVGFLNPAIYAIGQSTNYLNNFHDITVGNNTNLVVSTKYFAVPGYDLCTGWGTPNGQALIESLVPDPLVIQPTAGFNVSGPTGGPFNFSSTNLLLANTGTNALPWSLLNIPSWLTVSVTNGTLAVNATNNVPVALSAAAATLVPGSYNAALLFSNANTQVAQARTFSLLVFDPLTVTPLTGFTSDGLPGGPFTITTESFVLSNLGAASLTWELVNTSAWLNVSASGGTIGAGEETNLAVSLDLDASNLPGGTYTTTVSITNQTSGLGSSRQFTIQASFIQNGGFETGDFTGWTLDGDSSVNFVTNAVDFYYGSDFITIIPHSGNYDALLGEPYEEAYLSQTVPTLPGQTYLLSLWMDSPDGLTPNEFSVAWNGNTLFDQTDLPELGWTNLVFLVSATNEVSALQIGARDDPTYLALDDVNLTPIPNAQLSPSFVAATNGVSFSWNALAGLEYQIQFATNLFRPTWVVMQTITATNSSITFTDTNSIAGTPRKFYRLLLLP